MKPVNIRLWHQADMPTAALDVRFRGVKRTWRKDAVMSANDRYC
jgi:hypothetical protein